MAHFRSLGGCTHGYGVDEHHLVIYLLSFPAVDEIKDAITNFTGVKCKTLTHHKEEGN